MTNYEKRLELSYKANDAIDAGDYQLGQELRDEATRFVEECFTYADFNEYASKTHGLQRNSILRWRDKVLAERKAKTDH